MPVVTEARDTRATDTEGAVTATAVARTEVLTVVLMEAPRVVTRAVRTAMRVRAVRAMAPRVALVDTAPMRVLPPLPVVRQDTDLRALPRLPAATMLVPIPLAPPLTTPSKRYARGFYKKYERNKHLVIWRVMSHIVVIEPIQVSFV
jgi:hypothetical protein